MSPLYDSFILHNISVGLIIVAYNHYEKRWIRARMTNVVGSLEISYINPTFILFEGAVQPKLITI